MRGEHLIVQIRIGDKAIRGAYGQPLGTKQRDGFWIDIRYGKKRMVYCECGGAVMDKPDALDYRPEWGGCSHLVLLYDGHVTEDARELLAAPLPMNFTYAGPRRPQLRVRLTERGKKMFYHRWAAKALAS